MELLEMGVVGDVKPIPRTRIMLACLLCHNVKDHARSYLGVLCGVNVC